MYSFRYEDKVPRSSLDIHLAKPAQEYSLTVSDLINFGIKTVCCEVSHLDATRKAVKGNSPIIVLVNNANDKNNKNNNRYIALFDLYADYLQYKTHVINNMQRHPKPLRDYSKFVR